MAIVYATKSGNWSDTTVWNTGALPTVNDDVYANGFTVTIDISPTVLSIQNGTAAGVTGDGGFTASANGLTLTCTGAGVICGSTLTTRITFSYTGTSGNTFNIIGNVTGGPGNTTRAVNNASSGTVNITGNVTGGNVQSGSGSAFGVNNASTGTVNITGNVTAGTNQPVGGGLSHGANNNSTGTINITGTVIGSSNVANAYGFVNASTGTVNHIGTAQATDFSAAIGFGVVGQITLLTGPLLSSDASYGGSAASGVNPCVALRWFPLDTALSTFEYRMRGQTVSGADRPARQMFFPNAYSSTYPSTSIVRTGIAYGPTNIYVGICSVPPREAVSFGVPVDNTTGTSMLGTFSISDIWNYPISGITTAGSIGERLKNSATLATVSKQVSDAFSGPYT